jgi:hypothetical protein
MKRFAVAVVIILFTSGCGGGLSEAGLGLRTAVTSETFGGFDSGFETIRQGSVADGKFSVLSDLYMYYFQTGQVAKKEDVSSTSDSFLYCAWSSSILSPQDDCTENSFLVSNIVEANGKIVDFDFSRGSSKTEQTKFAFGVASSNMRVNRDGYELVIQSATYDGEETCFIYKLVNSGWKEIELNVRNSYAWSSDGIRLEHYFGGMAPIGSDPVYRGSPPLLSLLCFKYPIDKIRSIEFTDDALRLKEDQSYIAYLGSIAVQLTLLT